jgi:hypothetical protein
VVARGRIRAALHNEDHSASGELVTAARFSFEAAQANVTASEPPSEMAPSTRGRLIAAVKSARVDEQKRVSLRRALEDAKNRVHGALDGMDQTLTAAISANFVESLYPTLASENTRVADDFDPDDDATADPRITA